MTAKFLPYIEVDGCWTLRDSDIMAMFDRIEAQGLKDVVFYQFVCDRNKFLEIMKYSNARVYILFDGPTVAGLVWLNRFEGRLARLHFCFFQGYQGDWAVAAARQWLEQIMHMKDADGDYIYDVLIGLTPEKNQAAITFLRRVGAVTAVAVPNAVFSHKAQQSEPAMISYFTRECLT